MVVHETTLTEDDTKMRSMRLEVVLVTRVASVTIWLRLKDDTTDNNLKYKGEVLKKLILKSPIKTNWDGKEIKMLHKVVKRVSKIE